RVQPGDILAGVTRLDIFGLDLIERHRCSVDEPGARGTPVQHFLGNDGAGVKADRAALEQISAPYGNEIGRARPGANEMNGHGLVQLHWVIGMAGRQAVMLPTASARATERRLSDPPRVENRASSRASNSSV